MRATLTADYLSTLHAARIILMHNNRAIDSSIKAWPASTAIKFCTALKKFLAADYTVVATVAVLVDVFTAKGCFCTFVLGDISCDGTESSYFCFYLVAIHNAYCIIFRYNVDMTKKDFVNSERSYTVDLLKKLKPQQWQARTLCLDWSVEDLSAHLVAREHSAVGGLGLISERFYSLHQSRLEKVKKKGHKYIISELEKMPWYIPASANVAEFWIHNEDILRGELNMKRSEPDLEVQKYFWSTLKLLARLQKSTLSDLGSVILENTQTNQLITLTNHHSDKNTIIKGLPGELLLYFYGRKEAAKIKLVTTKL